MTFRAALYARVSTEDRQSPEDSIAWQRSVATALIGPHGGPSSSSTSMSAYPASLPWSRRPEASRLLQDCARQDRAFDALVIGEPQRAFAGTQYGLTAPILWHHGVELWVPEVGGRVDPDSEAHDLVMSLFGGLSKAERARIQRRVRNAMQTMARAGGRYLGGRPPYGYRLVPVSAAPERREGARRRDLEPLEPDPVTAPVVERIFAERLAGAGLLRDRSRPQRPSGSHHRHSTIRAETRIATDRGGPTPPYERSCGTPATPATKCSGRQRRDYELIDLSSPADGHVRRMRWNDPSTWIWSPEPTHEALVSRENWHVCKQ